MPDEVLSVLVVVPVVVLEDELEGVLLVSACGAVVLAGWLVSALAGAGALLVSGVDCA
jgi:hypothetical protein